MPTITRTIGASGADYTTVAAWAADLTNAVVYAIGDTAIGQVIDWSAVCAISLPTASVRPSDVILRPAANRRHTGRIGTGCRLLPRNNGAAITIGAITYNFTVDGFEIDYEGAWAAQEVGAVTVIGGSGNAGTWLIQNLICYGYATAGGSNSYGLLIGGSFAGPTVRLQNCVVHRVRRSSSFGGTVGIAILRSQANEVYNCVVFDTQNTSTGSAQGFSVTAATTIRNCVAIGNKTADFAGTAGTASNNASGDLTAPGASSITSLTEQAFAAIRGGDCSPVSGSALIGAGTTISGLTTDLAGNNYGSPRPIGAREFVASGGGASGFSLSRLINLGG